MDGDAPPLGARLPVKRVLAVLRTEWRWWVIPMLITVVVVLTLWSLQAPEHPPPMHYDIPAGAP